MDKPHKLASNPFIEALGPELVAAAGGRSEVRLHLEERHENSLGVAHGGVVMALLDVAMVLAAKSSDPGGRGVVTVDMQTSFLRPAKGEIRAFGWCEHYSSTMAFCRAELRDSHDRLLAQAMGTFKRMTVLGRRRLQASD